ncbi:hypothetical protein D3C72_1984120 [compost metagenome]
MPAKARSRIKRHVAERLGFRRLDHFPHVDAHGLVDDLQLVDEGDVDRAEDVLGQLDRFGRGVGRYRHHRLDHRGIEPFHQACRERAIAGNDFRNAGRLVDRVARIFAFG